MAREVDMLSYIPSMFPEWLMGIVVLPCFAFFRSERLFF